MRNEKCLFDVRMRRTSADLITTARGQRKAGGDCLRAFSNYMLLFLLTFLLTPLLPRNTAELPRNQPDSAAYGG